MYGNFLPWEIGLFWEREGDELDCTRSRAPYATQFVACALIPINNCCLLTLFYLAISTLHFRDCSRDNEEIT